MQRSAVIYMQSLAETTVQGHLVYPHSALKEQAQTCG